MNRHYGWKHDILDIRDLIYLGSSTPLPASVDLRPECPPVRDQGQVGSCTAFAITGALGYDRIKQHLPALAYSELFLYWNERKDKEQDDGARIRDGIKSAVKQGVCAESLWPYDPVEVLVQPTAACYEQAVQHKALTYRRVPQFLTLMQSCLADGYPFVAGFTVFESFESAEVASTGIVPMPAKGEQELGGHAILVVGYENEKQMFICQNSWSTTWGDKGFFYMPYPYLLSHKLASDFWTVRTVE